MAVTILEALVGAEHNLRAGTAGFQRHMGRQQLHNAVFLLQKGHGLNELVWPLLKQYGDEMKGVECDPD